MHVLRVMRRRAGLLVGTACLCATFGMGYALGYHVHTPPTICVQVNADGNVAPTSCTNPNSYQVNN